MSDIFGEPWFIWGLVVIIGLPLLTIALTELQAHLVRRSSSMARPVQMLRTYILPLAATLVLLIQIPNDVISNDGNWVKITATVFGLLVLVFVLSGLNTALFLNAAQGSWRARMPSIFVDILRIILIGIGLGVIFSWVWGTDVGGLFAALGVTSIVLGFALQNAVGSIISGLLLLFEQPFRLGDHLQAAGATGRVVEVNWRSVHIETGNGMLIVPNSSLASSAFSNLSRPTVAYTETIESVFTEDDPPMDVIELLNDVGRGITLLAAGSAPRTVMTAPSTFRTSLPLNTYADVGAARAQFLTRVWYAARRANLALNGADIWKGEGVDDVRRLLGTVASRLHLREDELDALAARMDLERYADGEIIEFAGRTPRALRWISDGRVELAVPLPGGGRDSLLTLRTGDFLGLSALSLIPTEYAAIAGTEVTVLVVPAPVLDELVRQNSRLARELGQQSDQRRSLVDEALESLPLSRTS